MVIRRPPRSLPGMDALLLHTILLVMSLAASAVIVPLYIATVAGSGADMGHLPWPLVRWALTTPLGALVLALVAGVAWGLPAGVIAAARLPLARAMDVTELPVTDWWAHSLPSAPDPGEFTRAEYWLGRGRRQRMLSLLALTVAVLVSLGFFAAYIAATWYGISHFPDCSGSRCPPTYGHFVFAPLVLGFVIMYLIVYGRTRAVERRCGIWFRMPDRGTLGGFTCYVRAPGVTHQAAAASLAHYSRGRDHRSIARPAARRALATVLSFLPFFLVQTAIALLVAWLPTQWTPT